MTILNIPTKKELIKLYCVDGLTTYAIAKVYGCSRGTIVNYIRRYDILIKHPYNWKRIITKDELIRLYYDENRSIRDISQIYFCSYSAIRGYFAKYNLQLKDRYDAQMVSITKYILISDFLMNILNGLVLGDGCLQSPLGFQALYTQASNKKEFIDYVAAVLEQNNYFSWKQYHNRYDKNLRKFYDTYYLHSKRTMELKELYNKWYLDGKKHVPSDIELTPNTVLFWYLGDGTVEQKRNCLYLCTDAFSIPEQQVLVTALDKVGIHADIVKHNKYYRIRISRKDNFYNFMKYMGKNPVSCYDYKFIPEFQSGG